MVITSRLTRLGGARHPIFMPIRESLAEAIVESFLGGSWTITGLSSRAGSLFAIERPRQWLDSLVTAVLVAFPASSPRPTARTLKSFIINNTQVRRVERREGEGRLKRRRIGSLIQQVGALIPPANRYATIDTIGYKSHLAESGCWSHLSHN